MASSEPKQVQQKDENETRHRYIWSDVDESIQLKISGVFAFYIRRIGLQAHGGGYPGGPWQLYRSTDTLDRWLWLWIRKPYVLEYWRNSTAHLLVGTYGMEKFLQTHRCNEVCRWLGLRSLNKQFKPGGTAAPNYRMPHGAIKKSKNRITEERNTFSRSITVSEVLGNTESASYFRYTDDRRQNCSNWFTRPLGCCLGD